MAVQKNLKIRTKLLLALLPLVVMVIVARLYSSIESKRTDTRYSELIDNDVKTLQNLTEARALTNRYGLDLYQEIAELDPGRMAIIDGNLDKTYTDFQGVITETLRQSPNRASEINAIADLFNEAVSASRPVRAAALINSNEKAMNLMRGGVDADLQHARQAANKIVEEVEKSIDQQSADLTAKSHRAILITWLVIAQGGGPFVSGTSFQSSAFHKLHRARRGAAEVWYRPTPAKSQRIVSTPTLIIQIGERRRTFQSHRHPRDQRIAPRFVNIRLRRVTRLGHKG